MRSSKWKEKLKLLKCDFLNNSFFLFLVNLICKTKYLAKGFEIIGHTTERLVSLPIILIIKVVSLNNVSGWITKTTKLTLEQKKWCFLLAFLKKFWDNSATSFVYFFKLLKVP